MRFLLVVVVAMALAGPAAAACPTLADLEGEVMCPQCKTTLDQSDAPVARDIKRFIETRADACVPESQIKDELVAQFGRRQVGSVEDAFGRAAQRRGEGPLASNAVLRRPVGRQRVAPPSFVVTTDQLGA